MSLAFLAMYSFPGMKKVLELTLEETSESPGMFASGDHLSGSTHSIPPRQLCCIPDYLLDATVVRSILTDCVLSPIFLLFLGLSRR